MSEPRVGVILLAGGRTKENHLGNERLLTRINGKPLLIRTIQQFYKHAPITVVTGDDKIANAVAAQRNIKFAWLDDNPEYQQIDMIRKGLTLAWARRSIILFGDVVFTDEAVTTIMENEADGWAVYGRSTGSEIVGTPYAEYFAIEVNWATRQYGKRAAREVLKHHREGRWPSATAWEWYRQMEGMSYAISDPSNVRVGPHWVEINDATDDIDFAKDAENLQKAHAKA